MTERTAYVLMPRGTDNDDGWMPEVDRAGRHIFDIHTIRDQVDPDDIQVSDPVGEIRFIPTDNSHRDGPLDIPANVLLIWNED